MIAFANDTDGKSFRNAIEFSRLHWTLISRVLPALQEEMRERGTNLVITSVWRKNSSDHRTYRAVDVRVWTLLEDERVLIETKMNAQFPVPDGERPTVKYYHPGNSSYPAHLHVRIPPL